MNEPLTAPMPERKDYELTPAGTHVATVFKIINLGHIEDEYKGETKIVPKIRVYWELPNKMKTFETKDGEKTLPFAVSREFTLSMGEKSNLRPIVVGITGAQFASEEEAHLFNISSLIGQSCLVTVVHKQSKSGKPFASVVSCSPLIEGMPIPDKVNEQIFLDVRAMSKEEIEELPEFIREDMKSSVEYKQRFESKSTMPEYPEGPNPEDVPF